MKMVSMRECVVAAVVVVGCGSWALAGPLTPPAGPIASTPGPEPRIAINATNTPGDADSVFKITAPGSYFLTGNMTGEAGKHGIEIVTGDVTIDLMGFEVLGVPGSLDGIVATEVSLSVVEIRNGTVRSWGGDGVDLGTFGVVGGSFDRVRSSLNGGRGMSTGAGAIVTHCLAFDNSGTGIACDNNSVVSECVSRANTGFGIQVVAGATVTACVASQNTLAGILTGGAARIVDCTAYDNDGDGIDTGSSSVISGCAASSNGGDGIEVSSDSHVFGNTCDSNGTTDGAGIHAITSDNRIEANNCTDNDRGIDVDAAGNIVIRNTCSGNGTQWDIAIGNAVGPIVSASTNAAAITGSTYAGSVGSTDPNANFTY
jgi:parallel beta-helix repeat protein